MTRRLWSAVLRRHYIGRSARLGTSEGRLRAKRVAVRILSVHAAIIHRCVAVLHLHQRASAGRIVRVRRGLKRLRLNVRLLLAHPRSLDGRRCAINYGRAATWHSDDRVAYWQRTALFAWKKTNFAEMILMNWNSEITRIDTCEGKNKAYESIWMKLNRREGGDAWMTTNCDIVTPANR